VYYEAYASHNTRTPVIIGGKMAKPNKGKSSDWELEAALDLSVTLEDLISAPAFRDASDEHGHSVTAGTRIPQWLHRRVVKLREMGGSPYELNSDVLRDALYLGLQILHMRYKVGEDWDVEKKMAAILDATGASRRIKEHVDEMVTGLEELTRGGDEEQAARRLTEYVYAAAALTNEWYRTKLFRLLQDSRVVRDVAKLCDKAVQRLILERKGK